jgi:endonuclease YncB( thermonuclease family)
MWLWPCFNLGLAKLFTLALLLISYGIGAATIQGKVVGVADGDTLTILDANKTQHIIRLQGIDAPEKAQAFGQKSKQSLSQMVHSKQVTIEFMKKDKYGRTVGKVLFNGADICLEQIKLGMAWHYKQYESEQPKEEREIYAQAELAAREKTIGIWKDKNPTPPWEFRKQAAK